MIFGFNTDVKYGDAVYHVQSEPRPAERLLETQIFVGGRCIGKRSAPYAESAPSPDVSEDRLQEMLKTQHRQVLDAVREGRLYEIISERQGGPEEQKLVLEWLNADSPYAGNAIVLRLRVSARGAAIDGASITSRLSRPDAMPVYAHAFTDSDGQAEMRIQADEAALPDSAILVQATHEGDSATRKFHLKRSAVSPDPAHSVSVRLKSE